MKQSLRIVIADDEPEMLIFLEEALKELGHEVVGSAADGRQLVEACRATRPDLMITDIKMPALDGIEASVALYPELGVPCILVSAYHDEGLIARAEANHVMAYLVKPIRCDNLKTAIAIAVRRHAEITAVMKEAADLKQALADRKVVERAKGVIMKHAGLDEEAAFRRLQDLASTEHKKLAEIAHLILTMEEALKPGEKR
jgi:response regulator NasT